jgi:hypothetical protein
LFGENAHRSEEGLSKIKKDKLALSRTRNFEFGSVASNFEFNKLLGPDC